MWGPSAIPLGERYTQAVQSGTVCGVWLSTSSWLHSHNGDTQWPLLMDLDCTFFLLSLLLYVFVYYEANQNYVYHHLLIKLVQ